MRRLILTLIAGYSRFISPLTGRSCRFYPTCSDYARQAVEEFGTLKGGWMAIRRIGKCHPWHPGGFDPVKNHSHNGTKDSDTCCYEQFSE
jgi:hypothetical protein